MTKHQIQKMNDVLKEKYGSPYAILPFTDGYTAGEHMIPLIEEAYQTKNMPVLLGYNL